MFIKKFFLTVFFAVVCLGAFSQAFNPAPSINATGSANAFTGGYTFAYATSGSPWSGAFKFKNGKRYHGKGSFARALQSEKRLADLHQTSFDISDINWTPSTSNEQSFRDEAKRLEADGGKNNPDNYNIIDSPGSHKYKQDQ